MRQLLLAFLLSATCTLVAAPSTEGLADALVVEQLIAPALVEAPAGPIFGKRKTSNKKQLKFAKNRSRRNGRGVMRARKNRGKNKARQGGRSKKKEGCNT